MVVKARQSFLKKKLNKILLIICFCFLVTHSEYFIVFGYNLKNKLWSSSICKNKMIPYHHRKYEKVDDNGSCKEGGNGKLVPNTKLITLGYYR